MKKEPSISLGIALIPVLFLIIALGFNVLLVFGDSALDGSNQIILLCAGIVAGLIAAIQGISWQQMHEGVLKSINAAMPSILILMLIGALSGTWMLSGIVPTMIYYGLQILHPSIFLFATCIICSVVSVATGSSWTTVATVGIALVGIGKALEVPDGLIAGAIISGAYFGDKLSPLSDTTNLSAAMAEVDLFDHIRYMLFTTIPSISIALILYLIIGFWSQGEADTNVQPIMEAISAKFNVSAYLFLVPLVVVIMILKKVPAIPVLIAGIFLGAIASILAQPHLVMEVGSPEWPFYTGVMKSIYGEISFTTNHQAINDLLSSSGMAGMFNTIWLILCAMVFGGIMEGTGMLSIITQSIISKVKSTTGLVVATSGTCITFNALASDQYLSIVIPGRMYLQGFRDRKLAGENLSRTLEDSGTVTSALVPWNTCGAYHTSVLGISTLIYLPYCFFNLISPLMTITFSLMNIKIKRQTT